MLVIFLETTSTTTEESEETTETLESTQPPINLTGKYWKILSALII